MAPNPESIVTKWNYEILKLEENRELLPLDFPIVVNSLIFSWTLLVLYSIFRVRAAYLLGRSNPGASLLWLALVEIAFLLPRIAGACDMFSYIAFGTKGKQRCRYKLVGDRAPNIDVVITCCGESIDIIMDTAIAAASQDYPSQCFQVFVLDDGQNNELKAAIKEYSQANYTTNREKIEYLSRVKPAGQAHYFKSGNLAFGLAETRRFGASEYFAALDADMIPETDWLRRIIPHLILDETLALVNPAQRFYNVPPGDILGQGGQVRSVLNDLIGPINDNLNTAQCFGTGYIIRRLALDSIGGYPLVDVAEDVFLSHVLSGHDWGISFVAESVQTGLAADSFRARVKQHIRRIDGSIHLCKSFNHFLPRIDPLPRRTWPQALAMFSFVLRLYTNVTDLAIMLLIPLLLWMADPGITTHPHSERCYLWPKIIYLVLVFVERRTNGLIYSRFAGSKGDRFWVAPWNASRIMRSLFLPTASAFDPTGTVLSPSNERSSRKRKHVLYRLLTPEMTVYVGYILLATASLSSFLFKFFIAYWTRSDKSVFSPYTPAAIIEVQIILQMALPLQYMTWPPTTPERRQLMEQDILGNYRPKSVYENVEEVKVSRDLPRRKGIRYSWLQILNLALILLIDWVGK